MAQCKETAQEFIQEVFSPLVAVLCSTDVQAVCDKNNLTFVELIQPFCQLNTEAHIRDVNNVMHTVRSLRIVVQDMGASPPQGALARRLLNDAVAAALPPPLTSDLMPNNVLTVGNHDLQLDASTPWFEAYRTAFLQQICASEHEFLCHYVACIFVVSSCAPDAMDQFARLTAQQHAQQHQQQHALPRWFAPNVLRYYVLVHDVTAQEEARAEAVYQTMKTKYGVQSCHLLHLNSRVPSAADPTMTSDLEVLPNPWSRFVTKRRDNQDSTEQDLFLEDEEENSADQGVNPSTPHAVTSDGSLTEEKEDPIHQSGLTDTIIYDPLGSNVPNGGTASNHHIATTDKQRADIDPAPVNRTTAKTAVSVQHGAALTLSDHERLRVFTHEFMVRGLIAWAEKTIRTLSEQASARKSIHRSLFSATKKWFGGNKQPTQTVIMNNTNVVYMSEAPEMQTRRLGDLAFMFQLYELAYQVYHAAKKDFNNDHALIHYAGAMEMACLAVFMQGASSSRQYPLHYMETTISTYLAVAKVPYFATRATLLSTEVLKSKGLYAEAAMQLVKLTSEESDLRSALLLEQAAHCFIRVRAPMVRRYAFHMVLAGHRYIKAGQRHHALRSYAQALQVFRGRGWTLAEDHINFTIGMQSFGLRLLDVATSAFKHLLSADSKQSLLQQAAFLKEYLAVFKQFSQHSAEGGVREGELPQLPLPTVEINSVKLLCGDCTPVTSSQLTGSRVPASGVSFNTTEDEDARFSKLEELIVTSSGAGGGGGGGGGGPFRPTIQCFTNRTNNCASPLIVVEESVTVEVEFFNPVKVGLLMQDLVLLWKFVPGEDSSCTEPTNRSGAKAQTVEMEFGKTCDQVGGGVIQFRSIPEVVLEGMERKLLHLSLSARSKGQLQITGLAFNLACLVSTATQPPSTAPLATDALAKTSNPLPFSSSRASVEAAGPPGGAGGVGGVTAPPGGVSMAGRVTLDVQGPRLNGTKEEKMGLLYALDKRLSPIIIGRMPRLEVYFCCLPSSLLSGEVRRITIELFNAGERPLSNVRLASSHPHFFTTPGGASVNPSGGGGSNPPRARGSSPPHQTGADAGGTEAYPVLIGSRESVMNAGQGVGVEPRGIGGVTGGLVEGELEPGATVTVVLWIRGPDTPGVVDVDFLFVYGSSKGSSRPRHRVVRHTARVTVHPSLLVRASCTRTLCHTAPGDPASLANSVAVSVELENSAGSVPSCMSSKFSVRQISCASRDWRLLPLGSRATSEATLSSNECLQLLLHANKADQSSSSKSRSEIVFTNVSFDTKQIDVVGSVAADFYYRSRLVTVETTPDTRFSSLPRPRTQEEPPLATLSRALDVGLTLIVLWQASVCDNSGNISIVNGQHHVPLTRVNCPVACPPVTKTPVEQPPVRFMSAAELSSALVEPSSELTSQLVIFHLRHEPSVQHDFSKQRLCLVRVTLDLLNSTDAELEVDLDTRASHDRSLISGSHRQLQLVLSSLYEDRPSLRFTWAGPRATRLRLGPRAARRLALTACFSAPGLYDLTSLQLVAGPAGDLAPSGRPIQPDQNLAVSGVKQGTDLNVIVQSTERKEARIGTDRLPCLSPANQRPLLPALIVIRDGAGNNGRLGS